MENDLYLFFLLMSALAVVSATPTSSPPLPPDMPSTGEQLHNIIEALIGAIDFRNWADVLSVTDPSTFPITATLFIPSDDAITSISTSLAENFDPSIVLYHIVPQELTFSDLQKFPIGFRLTTLLPHKSILVTNNASSNFTIDDCLITHPDLIINGAFSIHGIRSVFNSTIYGSELLYQSSDPPGPSSPPLSPAGIFWFTVTPMRRALAQSFRSFFRLFVQFSHSRSIGTLFACRWLDWVSSLLVIGSMGFLELSHL